MRAGDRTIPRQVDRRRPGEGRLTDEGVLADVDEDGARPTRASDVEGLGDRARDLVGIGHEVVVLGDRHRDAADVRLLEGIGPDRAAGHLAGDRDDRHRVHVGVSNRGHEVGRARPRRGHAHADLSGRRGIPFSGVARALFVAHEDVAHLGGVHERVVCRQDRATRDAEDRVDTDRLEREDKRLCTRYLLRRNVIGRCRSRRSRVRVGGVGPGTGLSEVGRGRFGRRRTFGHDGHHFWSVLRVLPV